MEFERGKKYTRLDSPLGGVVTFLCESVEDPQMLVFEIYGQPFIRPKKEAAAMYWPWVAPIKCERWVFFNQHPGFDAYGLCEFTNKADAEEKRSKIIGEGYRCSDVFNITGTIR